MDNLKLYGKSTDDLEALLRAVRIFTDDIKTKFGISKCATFIMNNERKVEDDGIQVPGGVTIEYLGDDAYKYEITAI